jgi:nitrogen fixation protein NifX
MSQDLSRAVALRIGLAARALPETSPQRLLHVLVGALGLPLTEEKLSGLNVKTLKTALDGEFAGIEPVYLKQAVRYLKGEESVVADEAPLPQPQPYSEGELPGSIRVAFASNSGERLDGHFGSCARFLVYQVTATDSRLIAMRPVVEPDTAIKDERNAYRAGLIGDCHILYVVSIGGPPAAKVIRAGVHPLKHPQEAEIPELLPPLQGVLAGRPPPWLARIIGAQSAAVEAGA